MTGLRGPLLSRADEGYEQARQAAVWNARRPDRRPDCILLAADADDGAAGVRFAAARSLRIGIRSGGHSWIGNGVREGGLLIDLSGLDSVHYDPRTGRVIVGPAARSGAIDAALAPHGRFFPTGHVPGVGIGGFLLGGGYGWNTRALGPACHSIEAIDVVTAAGDLLHADADNHPDLLWAARGGGPGFPGLITAFHLRTYPRYDVARAVIDHPVERVDDVLAWSLEVAPWLPTALEISIKIGWPPAGGSAQPVVSVIGTTFTHDAEEGRTLLGALAGSGPGVISARSVQMADIYGVSDDWSASGLRWALDGIWVDGPAEPVVAGTRAMAATIPTTQSFVFVWPWGHVDPRPDAAWSVQAPLYISPVGAALDASEDARVGAWVTGSTAAMGALSRGTQFADADPVARPDHGLSPTATKRLEAVRGAYDPDGRFHRYLSATD